MRKIAFLFLLLPLIILYTSCGEVGDVGEKVDPAEPMDGESKSYMRTAVSGVAPGETNIVEVVTIEDPGPLGDEIAIMRGSDDGSKFTVTLTRATYTIKGSNITIYPYLFHSYAYAAYSNPASESGASREIYDQSTPETHAFSVDDLNGELTYGSHVYKRMDFVYDAIMAEPMGPEDRERDIMRMYELTTISSQVKIKGFGGIGMFDYFNETNRLKGIRSGYYDLIVSGKLIGGVTTTFAYAGYSDHAYMTLDGRETSKTGYGSADNGDGNMEESVTLTISGESGDTWTVVVDYTDIILDDTLPQGTYSVKVGTDDAQDVDAVIFQPGHFDYTTILDPDPGTWTY
jgi:hypothetical protein